LNGGVKGVKLLYIVVFVCVTEFGTERVIPIATT
jgi:hypothetical protein